MGLSDSFGAASAARSACGFALVALLTGWPAQAQTVTFDVYPPEAKVYRQGATPDDRVPLGQAGRPLNLGPVLSELTNVRVIIDTEDGKRRPWSQTLVAGFPIDSRVRVYLAPRQRWRYLLDPPIHWPIALKIAALALLAGIGIGGRRLVLGRQRRLAQTELDRRAAVLASVGAEYERVFGRWLIVGKIGSGGMGEVLRAFPLDSIDPDHQVAIKLRAKFDQANASKELTERENDERARFAIETKVLCGLNHPGIVKVYDWGEIDGRDYYAMELVKGQDLQSYLDARGRLSYSETRDLFSQILGVVQFAHGQGVLHRDLKPLNILREPNGRIKVIDFGLARDQNQTVAYTQVGMPFAGSLEYMDPRVALQMFGQIAPTPSDQGTDQFALGGILFLMLTGRSSIDLPKELDAQGLIPILTKVGEPRPSPRMYRPDLPEEIEVVVTTMLALPVEDRYPSLTEALAAFLPAITPYLDRP